MPYTLLLLLLCIFIYTQLWHNLHTICMYLQVYIHAYMHTYNAYMLATYISMYVT